MSKLDFTLYDALLLKDTQMKIVHNTDIPSQIDGMGAENDQNAWLELFYEDEVKFEGCR